MEDFLITSYTGSGVAWLLNFFVENNILVYRGKDIESTWKIKNNIYNLRDEQQVLKQWLPCLSEKESIIFSESISIRWAHEFPDGKNSKQKTILLVRDGRDCIYSQFKREEKHLDFLGMLKSGVEPFNLKPAETWALHNYLWLKKISKEKLFIIKFEDIKSDPFPVLKKMLNFLQIELTDDQIFKGIESSGFDRAKKAEEEYRQQAEVTQFKQVNRKGTVGEWKTIYGKKELEFFEGLPNYILKKLGYEVSGSIDYSSVDIIGFGIRVYLSKIKLLFVGIINRLIYLSKKVIFIK
ncbi:MAG: sulfotransferase domain-containing protein [Patescibacteria group bacterium]|nr:sulfotransferase domain-containing protein [Patescibacteria group bacterium]